MKDKKMLMSGLVMAVVVMMVTSCSYLEQENQPDFVMGRPQFDSESGCMLFSFCNVGYRDISSVKVEGYCWRNSEYVPVRGSFSEPIPAQTEVTLKFPIEDTSLEPGKFFVKEVQYSDSSVWQDPAGIFANYYVRQ